MSSLGIKCATGSPSRILKTNVYSNFFEAVGNTPLIRLNKASNLTRCEIWAKAEYTNPGGSVKDRPAKKMIQVAEEKGLLKEGLIVEGSAGNTAIGLALAGNCRNYKTICLIPNTQTKEKIEMLRIAGAHVVPVPVARAISPNHYTKIAERLAAKLNGFFPAQFDNKDNRLGHFETTGPEIWEQTDGKVDAFVSVLGTGGTLAGVSSFLRSKNPNVKCILADVPGAVLHRYYTEGVARAEGSSIVENIGMGRVTGNVEDFAPDMSFEIMDQESLPWTFSLLKEEGLPVGMTSGVNLAGAVRTAKILGPNTTIVTVLCDLGQRYAMKQYNPTYLKEMNLPFPEWLDNLKPNDVDALAEEVRVSEEEAQAVIDQILKDRQK